MKHITQQKYSKTISAVKVENGEAIEFLKAISVHSDSGKCTTVSILVMKAEPSLTPFRGLNFGKTYRECGTGYNRENEAFAALVMQNAPDTPHGDIMKIRGSGLIDYLKELGFTVFFF